VDEAPYEVLKVDSLSVLSERELQSLRGLEQELHDLTDYCVYQLRVPEAYRQAEEVDEFRLVAPGGFDVGDRVVIEGTIGNTISGTLGADEPGTSVDWATELHPSPDK
jgi:hypothetical protein